MIRLFQIAKSFFSKLKNKNISKVTNVILDKPQSATTILNKNKDKNKDKKYNQNNSKNSSKNDNIDYSISSIKKKRKPIPTALREQVWLKHFGKNFEHKCSIKWCTNIISVFNWECGHNIPHSKDGPTVLENLIPLCSRCNKSMNDHYTIDEFNLLGEKSIIDEEDEKRSK